MLPSHSWFVSILTQCRQSLKLCWKNEIMLTSIYLMIPACIVNIINWLSITHYQLTPWKAPTTILNQVSWPKTKSNQVKCKLNYQFKILWCPSRTVRLFGILDFLTNRRNWRSFWNLCSFVYRKSNPSPDNKSSSVISSGSDSSPSPKNAFLIFWISYDFRC